jgi:hypothetical protein
MTRKLLSLVGLGLALLGALVLFVGGPARADEPLQQGWWTVLTSPVGLPTKPPSDVPADGLLVQGGPQSPAAYAALVYSVPTGSQVGALTLSVTQPSASTPAATLQVCPLTSDSIVPDQGGPIAEAPAYNCASKVTAAADTTGNTYKFNVANLLTNGTLAVAILPTQPTNRVVFNKPTTSSLEVTAPTDAGATTDFTAPVEPPASDTPATQDPNTAALSAAQPPSAPLTTATTPPAPEVAPSPTAAAAQNFAPAAASSKDKSKSTPAGVGLTIGGLIVAATFWTYAGRDKLDGLEHQV